MLNLKIGDYVLATKYSDGDPCDSFCVGFIKEIAIEYNPVRYDIVDNDGNSFRGNGFRKVVKITQQEGELMIALFPSIGNKQGKSVWWHLKEIRKQIKANREETIK